jgi:large subunit ribosomal protein L1
MDKKIILDSVKKVREISKKRKFDQTFDISINLKQLDIKNPNEKIDLFLQLNNPKLKKPKVCALIDKELSTKAKIFDKVVLKDDFVKYKKDKKELKKLDADYDYFVAQANLMPEVAATFGKVLGQKGKMPNPKAGCVVPPTIDLEPLKERLNNQVRAITKDQLVIKVPIGSESMSDEDIVENILTVYNAILNAAPRKEQNIKSIFLKLTMSPSVQLTEKGVIVTVKKKKKDAPKKEAPKKAEKIKKIEEKKKDE